MLRGILTIQVMIYETLNRSLARLAPSLFLNIGCDQVLSQLAISEIL
jgi:hypothetical protein